MLGMIVGLRLLGVHNLRRGVAQARDQLRRGGEVGFRVRIGLRDVKSWREVRLRVGTHYEEGGGGCSIAEGSGGVIWC